MDRHKKSLDSSFQAEYALSNMYPIWYTYTIMHMKDE